MKILFICGSYEAGKDGVGDYIRRLSNHLCENGHEISIVAFYDRQAETIENTDSIESKISVLRLPSFLKKEISLDQLKVQVKKFKPDIISIQFVSFAFDDKGLPFGFAKSISYMSQNIPIHIMFHELWLGMEVNPSFKYRIWGFFQRRIVEKMVRVLKPFLSHTHTRLYQANLNSRNILTQYLPIFSNIPPLNPEALKNKGDKVNSGSLRLIVFGYLSRVNAKPFISELEKYSIDKDINVEIIFSGHNGYDLQNWINQLETVNIHYEVLGSLSAEDVSAELMKSDFGISTTPASVMEKSGSVAAMLEHQLPVINVSEDFISKVPFKIELDRNIYIYKAGNLSEILSNEFVSPDKDMLTRAADIFVEEINSVIKTGKNA